MTARKQLAWLALLVLMVETASAGPVAPSRLIRVSEPGTLVLLVIGLLLIAWSIKRRRR